MERFPPESVEDIAAYDLGECVEGYTEQKPDEPEPGANRSPAYRWGWQNRKRDRQPEDDGFGYLRQAYIEFRKGAIGSIKVSASERSL